MNASKAAFHMFNGSKMTNRDARRSGGLAKRCVCSLLALTIAGCTSLGASGPTTRSINRADGLPAVSADIKIVDLHEATARRVMAANRAALFSEALGESDPIGTIIGKGDILDIAVWEAPPAALFGSVGGEGALAAAGGGIGVSSRNTVFPEQMVDENGRVSLPFAGSIPAAGMTPRQIELEIVRRLKGKAHEPQAIVRLTRNTTANVTVVGDVSSSGRIPLTVRGERLLDIIATAGGVRQPVGRMTIRITRGEKVTSMPLERVLLDPAQNIRLKPDDVVTALFQPYTFTALGAVNGNAEVPFEATGLTVVQALGRVGGLNDARADIRGVFIFRLEDPAALDPALTAGARTTTDGKIPVIYRIDLRDPASFFVAQSFAVHNGDLLYVSNAPLTDLQKFVSIVSSMAFSFINIGNAVR